MLPLWLLRGSIVRRLVWRSYWSAHSYWFCILRLQMDSHPFAVGNQPALIFGTVVAPVA
jgi:hypothetical protein